MAIWLLPFRFIFPWSPHVVLLFYLGLQGQYWRGMERVDSLDLSPILEELDRVSLRLIWCWLLACCILLLVCLGIFVFSLISPRPLSWRDVGFCQRLFQHLVRWSCGFSLQFLYMVDYIDGFLYVETSLHPWDEAHLIMVDDFSDMILYSIC